MRASRLSEGQCAAGMGGGQCTGAQARLKLGSSRKPLNVWVVMVGGKRFYDSIWATSLRGFVVSEAAAALRRRRDWGRSERTSQRPAATAPAQVMVLRARDSRSEARLPRRGMLRTTAQQIAPAPAATRTLFANSFQGNSASETSFRRWRRSAAAIVFATMPRSDAMASPVTENA